MKFFHNFDKNHQVVPYYQVGNSEINSKPQKHELMIKETPFPIRGFLVAAVATAAIVFAIVKPKGGQSLTGSGANTKAVPNNSIKAEKFLEVPGENFSITLPDGESVEMRVTEASSPEPNVRLSVMAIEDDPEGEMVVCNYNGILGGTIRRGNGEAWEIQYLGNGKYTLAEPKTGIENPDAGCSSKKHYVKVNGNRQEVAYLSSSQPLPPRVQRGMRRSIRLNQTLLTKEPSENEIPVGQPEYTSLSSDDNPLELKYRPIAPTYRRKLDLLVLYTPGAIEKKYMGEERLLRAHIYAAVEEVKRAFSNSRVLADLNLVGVKKINVKGEATMGGDLGKIANAKSDPGRLARELQIEHKADLVCYIPDTGGGGVAFLGPGQVHSVSAYANARVIAHEIGHNLGMTHDVIPDKRNGAFGFGVGHVFETVHKGKTQRFHTIMSYGNNSRSILRFSNPFVRYRGARTGWLYHADCAAAINHTCQANSKRSDSLPK